MYWLGVQKFDEAWDLPVFWSEGEFSTLGIIFNEDENQMCVLNYTTKLQSFKEILKVWKTRKLSLIGKNIVLKSLATSKLLYPISLIHTDLNIIRTVQSYIYQFLWDDSTHKVKSTVMHQSIVDGGLKIIHFGTQVTALQLNWVNRIFNNSNAK